jgi:hypothetical protein
MRLKLLFAGTVIFMLVGMLIDSTNARPPTQPTYRELWLGSTARTLDRSIRTTGVAPPTVVQLEIFDQASA